MGCCEIGASSLWINIIQAGSLKQRVHNGGPLGAGSDRQRATPCAGDEAAWWHRLNIDPLPVALRLWQRTRADGKVVPITEDVTQAQAAKATDVSG
jgi:hypothetical protein